MVNVILEVCNPNLTKMEMSLFYLLSITCCSVVVGSIINNRIDEYAVGDECHLPPTLQKEIRGYQSLVSHIVDNIVYGKYAGGTYKSLMNMTDTFGPRLTGSVNLERAIDYMVMRMEEAKLENVHTEEANVVHWVRGYEAAEILLPYKSKLEILGLGTSVGTAPGGIVGDVVAVESFDELSKLPDEEIAGKIVVFVPKWTTYGETVQYRSRGASEASKRGAIATLIRSATPFSIGSPHTGMQSYYNGVKKIPTACITVEDAYRILRLYRNGVHVKIHLEMDDKMETPAISRNVIGELQGSMYPVNRSVVIVSGHLDSWDVGVGAMDDGGGAFISWKALQFLKAMKLRPKRTLRAILWTGEEFGYLGAREYQKHHYPNEEKEFNFFFESDIGTFNPTGLDFTGNKDAECIFKEVLKLMKPLNATQFKSPADGDPDVSLWVDRGFPGASLLNENERYFWFHHSNGDSMLVEDPQNLDKCTALFAAASFIIADLSIDIPKDVKKL